MGTRHDLFAVFVSMMYQHHLAQPAATSWRVPIEKT